MADLLYCIALNCVGIPNIVARQGTVIFTYPKNAVFKLAPGPDRVRIAHRLTVERSILTLILILTTFVACNLRSS